MQPGEEQLVDNGNIDKNIFDTQVLDNLQFIASKFDNGEWLPSDKVPSWAKDLTYPKETSNFKYYLTKKGNLKRYRIGEGNV